MDEEHSIEHEGARSNELAPHAEPSRFQKRHWRDLIYDIYDRMKAKRAPYETECNDLSLIVLPNVYAPNFFSDSRWFAEELPRLVGKASLLEIGTGTGVVALSCARQGARVVATDLNPQAVKNTRLNAERNHLNISVKRGDLYSPIRSNEKFDIIFWVHPLNNSQAPVNDLLLISGFDHNYNGLKGYVSGAQEHLTADGRLLLGTGESADWAAIRSIAFGNGYRVNVIREAVLPFEEGGKEVVVHLICEFVAR